MHSESELEVTLQTRDHSTTTCSTLDTSDNTHSRLNVTRDVLEKQQLLHNLELLKLEVSQKELTIHMLKAEHAAELEDLQERLSNLLREKQLDQLRLKSLSQVHEAELRRINEQTQQEVVAMGRKIREMEEVNPFIDRHVQDIKQAVVGPCISEAEYSRLKAKDVDSLPLKDYIVVHLYEQIQPLHLECETLADHLKKLTEDLTATKLEHSACAQNLALRDNQLVELKAQCSQLSEELSHVRSHVDQGDYRIEHYHALTCERDTLQNELETLKQAMQELESTAQAIKDRENSLQKELLEEKHTVVLLMQDKDYLGRQVNELTGRCVNLEDRCGLLLRQLDEARATKEKTLEHFLKAREDHKREYDIRIQQELDSLRLRMNQEMEQLRNQSKDTFGHEHRTLQESRDAALAERDRALTVEREMNTKYDHLLQEFRHLQMSSDSRFTALQSELQMKRFECEKSLVVQEIGRAHV